MNSLARRWALALVACCAVGTAHAQCVSLAAPGMPVLQDFNGLSATAGSTTNVVALDGWAMTEAGGGARDNEQYAVDTGASSTGDTYSYGAAGSAERALGSVRSGTLISTFGACYANATGATLTTLGVDYTAEQWRVGTIGRIDLMRLEYSTDATGLSDGTWTNVEALGFSTPDSAARNGIGSAGARDGNAAPNRLQVTGNITGLSVPAGGTLWLRWTDVDATSADDGMAIDDLGVTAGGVSGAPTLAISDTSVTEGDAGTATLLFTVSLNKPAGVGGVSFDYATADNTATGADNDFVARSGSATIAQGSTSVTLGVDANGDTAQEPDETFFVNLANVVGATLADAQAVGTISNDDVILTPIHAIQGSGQTSPLVGTTVSTRGIVTGRKSSGFFIQTADAGVDGDPMTSEGVFVFTNAAPPAAAAVGNLVQVTAAIAEYIPAADPQQLPLTELTAPTVLQISTGHALPTPMVLTTTLPSPAGGLDQLERYEGMRVTADSFTVAAPTKGSTSEANASGTSNGIFSVVVTGTARPFREPGIQVPDPEPTGTTATAIPRWDFNPELLTVDSDAIGGAQLNLPAGTVLANLVGPLDYGFRRYTLLADAGTVVNVGTTPQPSAARAPTADEFTVASYNLERFFDTSNDPAIGEPVLTAAAFDKRLAKASLAIREYLHSPDIVATMEVENLATLQALAARINADAAAAPVPSNPGYVAYLEEGNDVGGIDVGFLVKTAAAGAAPRVDVDFVQPYGKDETWLDPSDNTSHLLNDRPPLLLKATVHFDDGRVFPLMVLAVHQRSLNGIDSEVADGATTEGDRVRRKRQAQAEYLSFLVRGGGEHFMVLGDFNAFEFNDGYVDAMGTVSGTPSPDNQTAVNGDGADLVDPDLINLAAFEDADQHYSFVFDGNAQSLDHVLVNEGLAADAGGIDLDHARINADFPETERNNAASPSRLSDHDPAIAYIAVANADLAVSVAPLSQFVAPGGAMAFDATVVDAGPDTAQFPAMGFSFDADLPDLQVTAPAGWSCDVPTAAGASTVLSCVADALANGGSAVFHLAATAPAAKSGGSVHMWASASSDSFDPNSANDAASTSASVDALADLAVSLGQRVSQGDDWQYALTVRNQGPAQVGPGATLVIDTEFPAGVGSIQAPQGWTCEGSGLDLTCALQTGPLAAGASAGFTLAVPKRLFKLARITATVESPIPDPVPANNTLRKRLGLPTLPR